MAMEGRSDAPPTHRQDCFDAIDEISNWKMIILEKTAPIFHARITYSGFITSHVNDLDSPKSYSVKINTWKIEKVYTKSVENENCENCFLAEFHTCDSF